MSTDTTRTPDEFDFAELEGRRKQLEELMRGIESGKLRSLDDLKIAITLGLQGLTLAESAPVWVIDDEGEIDFAATLKQGVPS